MWADLKGRPDLIVAASALNNRFAQETSFLSEAEFADLVARAWRWPRPPPRRS